MEPLVEAEICDGEWCNSTRRGSPLQLGAELPDAASLEGQAWLGGRPRPGRDDTKRGRARRLVLRLARELGLPSYLAGTALRVVDGYMSSPVKAHGSAEAVAAVALHLAAVAHGFRLPLEEAVAAAGLDPGGGRWVRLLSSMWSANPWLRSRAGEAWRGASLAALERLEGELGSNPCERSVARAILRHAWSLGPGRPEYLAAAAYYAAANACGVGGGSRVTATRVAGALGLPLSSLHKALGRLGIVVDVELDCV